MQSDQVPLDVMQQHWKVSDTTQLHLESTLDQTILDRFTTIAENLHPGVHSVECELLAETKDPSGGHEFRIISLMR